ncbi:MAG TPA: NUDIX hydrolase [Lachnospiraceae bacterium]|nr:NUDIX hydrolase [Lachnospiraceae bacterium]
MPEKHERIGRKLIHKGNIVEFHEDQILLPDGRQTTFDFIKHIGAAAIVPVTDDGKILMVKQYRNAIDAYTLEIPAGGRDSINEPTIDTAYRELEEETGYRTEKLVPLVSLNTTIAFCNEKIDIFLARNLIKSHQHLDDDEYIDVAAYEVEDLIEMIYDGRIVDAKTMVAILAYKNAYLIDK